MYRLALVEDRCGSWIAWDVFVLRVHTAECDPCMHTCASVLMWFNSSVLSTWMCDVCVSVCVCMC